MFVIGAAQGEVAESAWRAQLRRAGADEEQELRDTIAHISEIAQAFHSALVASVARGTETTQKKGFHTHIYPLFT
ncbi:hypothetical protein [Nonomuraea insulae]|uniref:SAV-6107-like HEPN domain-containing protein n=1 Tax=Nonomuraea insulae TaxID=1616787 RepID=A0ABW1C9P4_9ACTN